MTKKKQEKKRKRQLHNRWFRNIQIAARRQRNAHLRRMAINPHALTPEEIASIMKKQKPSKFGWARNIINRVKSTMPKNWRGGKVK